MFGALAVPDRTGLAVPFRRRPDQSAKQHAAAWNVMFDDTFVDDKPRLAVTRAFRASRRIELTTGTPEDPAETPTVHGFANRTNNLVLKLINHREATLYPGWVRYLCAARDTGLPCAVVVSRANATHVLTGALRAHGADVVVGDPAELLDRS